jgi:hypothetical protein
LIAGLIKRDAPFYDPTISPEAIDGLNRFAKAVRLVSEAAPTTGWSPRNSVSCGTIRRLRACRAAISSS